MAIKVVVARAHEEQLKDPELLKEVNSIEQEINRVSLDYQDNTVNFVFIQGMYTHSERKMNTVCLFVNKMEKPLSEIHGELRLQFTEKSALIASAKLDFDQEFLGSVGVDEALLFHINIPVRGLEEDEVFDFSGIKGAFENVQVAFS